MTINPLGSRERVTVPPRKAMSKANQVASWNRANGCCWWCGKPVAVAGDGVEYDHKIPRELNASDDPEGIWPMHVRCHAEKTSGEDAPRIAKTRRQAKLTEAKVKKPNGFRGWRKMNGEPVWAKDRGR